jgi:uncharacterized protein (DUF433 family)
MFLPLNSLAFQITHFFHALNRGAQEFRRITMNPEIMGGKPCIRACA